MKEMLILLCEITVDRRRRKKKKKVEDIKRQKMEVKSGVGKKGVFLSFFLFDAAKCAAREKYPLCFVVCVSPTEQKTEKISMKSTIK